MMLCLQALYRGNGANVLRLVPEVALKFGFNDQLKIMFTPADGKPMSFSRKLAAGATAGVLKVNVSSHSCHCDGILEGTAEASHLSLLKLSPSHRYQLISVVCSL